MSTNNSEIKLPLEAVQEDRHIADQIWYVKDAAGLKMAITNEQFAKMFVNAVNGINELAEFDEMEREEEKKDRILKSKLFNLLAKWYSFVDTNKDTETEMANIVEECANELA